MCLYPEVQKKAQAELDQVLGARLPDFSDRPSLPYINAVVKESNRWQLVLPLGMSPWRSSRDSANTIRVAVPHSTIRDDEYEGYFIPRGTIVMGNAWYVWIITHLSETLIRVTFFRTILQDPDVFHDPQTFAPERFLKNGQIDPSIRDPSVAAFGFGRRICPGRHLSDNSLFITVASVLSVFDISPVLDKDGKPIKPLRRYSGDTLSCVFMYFWE